jgi:hypothetical protein
MFAQGITEKGIKGNINEQASEFFFNGRHAGIA